MYLGDPLEPRSKAKLIVGVGFQPLRLQDILSGGFAVSNVKLLMPFPSIPPAFEKNWAFVLHIKNELPNLSQEAIVRVPAHNVSLVFDQLNALTEDGRAPAVTLAPFGPKTISLAMCIYGTNRRSNSLPVEIGYTQPTFIPTNTR